VVQKDAKRIFQRNRFALQKYLVRKEYSPARGWDLEKDIITKTVGKKTVLDEYQKKTPNKIRRFS
jgi:endonuclease-3